MMAASDDNLPTEMNHNQRFRFHKSGFSSPLVSSSSSYRTMSNAESSSFAEIALDASLSDREPSGSPAEINSSSQVTPNSISSEVPAGVDPKLFFIVKKIVSSTPSLLVMGSGGNKSLQLSRLNNSQAVTDLILSKHREYRRKDIGVVKNSVECVLAALGNNSNNNNKSKGACSSGRKRKTAIPIGGGSNLVAENTITNTISFTDGTAVESPVLIENNEEIKSLNDKNTMSDCVTSTLSMTDTQPFALTVTNRSVTRFNDEMSYTGGMLNATLRHRYKDVQRERELAFTSASIENTPQRLPSTDQLEKIEVELSHSNAACWSSSSDNLIVNSSTCTPSREAAKETPKKKKKRTPSISKSGRSIDSTLNDSFNTNTTLLLPSPRPTERYSNLGGVGTLLTTIRELIEYPLSHPELFVHLGVEPPRGVLLRGPPGCGKTHLAKAIAGELNVSYFQVSAPELVGGVSGESESRVRTLFESAASHAPAIIFIDEIDAIAPKRGEGSGVHAGKSMEKRIVAQILTSMDGIHPSNTRNQSTVIVLGATNRPDALDPALRRAGRFDREIVLGAPDEVAREGILRVMISGLKVEGSLDYKILAKKTPGFVGADLKSLTKEAAVLAIQRIFSMDLLSGCDGSKGVNNNEEFSCSNSACSIDSNREVTDVDVNVGDRPKDDANLNDIRNITPLTEQQLMPLFITMDDFLAAIPQVQPSSKREGFATVPDVSWSDIGALADIREELTLSVLEPIAHPERFEALGLPLPSGVLLYGPSGCGKTLLAKAIANESGANFISVKGPELLDKYVGESERSVRVVFERARSSSPCIIFFDELDSLCPKRGSDGGGGGGVSERVVNQLLTEMDGIDKRRSVFVIAATNRPELIDPAMLRPGRLDKLLYVPLPSPVDRFSILRALSKNVTLAPDVDLHAIAHNPQANGFSGADCAALLREAGLAVLRDAVLNHPVCHHDGSEQLERKVPRLQITAHHFLYAFEHVLPSVSKRDQARYDRMKERLTRERTRCVEGVLLNESNEGVVDCIHIPEFQAGEGNEVQK